MRILGPIALLEHVHGKNLCVGCGGCVALCPYFKTYKGRTIQVFPCDIEQGRCYAHCPKAEVNLDDLAASRGFSAYEPSALGGVKRLLASRAGDRWKGKKSQSGGTVSALVAFALEAGKIASAVLTDQKEGEPVPVLVSTPEAVERCAYSKYTAAPTISALNSAMNEGRTNIGVVATPCQATAVAQIRANPLRLDNFKDPVVFVVGLFCTWALDTRKLLEVISERVNLSTIRKMDIPPPPEEVLIVDSTNGRIEFPLSEIRPLIPEGCRICPDMTAEWADVSVGVLEDAPEWNTLIIRTEVGEALVNEAVEKGWLSVRELPTQSKAHLCEAAGNKKRRALVKAQADGVLNTDPSAGPCALRLKPETVSAIIDGGEGRP